MDELRDKRLTIIGVGNIGRILLTRLRVAGQIVLGTAALALQTGLSFDKLKALTPVKTIDETAVSRLFRDAARTAKEKMDRAQEKL
ncbi:MAG: hypothetical protein ACE5F6_09160 [Anaerolineae bacterium]